MCPFGFLFNILLKGEKLFAAELAAVVVGMVVAVGGGVTDGELEEVQLEDEGKEADVMGEEDEVDCVG